MNLSLLKGCGDIFFVQDERKKKKKKKEEEEARGGCKLKLYPVFFFFSQFDGG